MSGPLSGLRVLELSTSWPAPGRADPGRPRRRGDQGGAARAGDDTRGWRGRPSCPRPTAGIWGSAYFHACNRGKRSVALDLDSESGRRAVQQARRASPDVVLENFKVGGLKKYGLDYQSLSALNPRLIYCSITGFGQTGPLCASRRL